MESLLQFLPLTLMIAIIWLVIRWQQKKVKTEPPGPNGEHPYGIRSWLALFIFVCFTFGPLLNIGTVFKGLGDAETQNPNLLDIGAWQTYKIVSWAVVAILIAWQVWMGYTLKSRLEPRSVLVAKVFLVGSLAFSAGTDVIAVFVLFHVGPGPEYFLALVKPGLASAIWFAYFSRSKRVRNTYRL
jgi:hypothetical protein